MKVKIGVSARHVHLTEQHFKILFGDNKELEKLKELSQPGEFASLEKVTIKTDKGTIEGVRILGPFRSYTQVEISKTDSFKLGLNPPVRESGNIKGSSPITIVGPVGQIDLEEGCIIASRHIHITPLEVLENHLEGIDKVKVKIEGDKGGILDNVSLKVSENYSFELHLDTDDANAHLINQGDLGEIIKGGN